MSLHPGPVRLGQPPRGMPSRLEILSQRWRVAYSADLMANRGCWGMMMESDRMIIIDTVQSREAMIDTLWHEVIHAIVAMQRADPNNNEAFTSSMTVGLIDVLRRNRRWW